MQHELDQKREQLQTLEMEHEGAKASRQEEEGRLLRAEARAQELEDEKKRSSMSMHEQESQLLQHISEIMTEQQTLKCKVSALQSERDSMAAATEQRKIDHASLLAHKASELKAAADANSQLQLRIQELESNIEEVRKEGELTRDAATAAATQAAEEAAALEARAGDDSVQQQMATLMAQLEEERRRHLMREGELEDKICETKIRMFQYRDESLQSVLGLDTMAELQDIICAIKAQQRESRNLRQLQMEARRQILGDAENMVKLLTGCRVFEMDLENMLRRVVEKRGQPENDPNFLESHLSKVLREFQRNFGGQRERAGFRRAPPLAPLPVFSALRQPP